MAYDANHVLLIILFDGMKVLVIMFWSFWCVNNRQQALNSFLGGNADNSLQRDLFTVGSSYKAQGGLFASGMLHARNQRSITNIIVQIIRTYTDTMNLGRQWLGNQVQRRLQPIMQ